MIELRPFEKLGKSDHGWLKANFHFSFADYRNKDRVHWGNLRVWNNDRIAPQSGGRGLQPSHRRRCTNAARSLRPARRTAAGSRERRRVGV